MEIELSHQHVRLAVDAAHLGGEYAQDQQSIVSSHEKDDGTPVTKADKQSEILIREKLTDATDIPVLGEEYGGEFDGDGTYWIVDPIDGTENYANGNPMFCTAICLVQDGEPYAGCVYAPVFNQTFYAVRDKGAYLNHEPLNVSETREDPRKSTLILTGHGSNVAHESLGQTSPWIQRTGTAIYSAASIAAGWVDAGLFTQLSPWDMACSVLLVREAGGTMRTLSAEKTDWSELSKGGAIATNTDSEIPQLIRDELTEETLARISDARYAPV